MSPKNYVCPKSLIFLTKILLLFIKTKNKKKITQPLFLSLSSVPSLSPSLSLRRLCQGRTAAVLSPATSTRHTIRSTIPRNPRPPKMETSRRPKALNEELEVRSFMGFSQIFQAFFSHHELNHYHHHTPCFLGFKTH